MPTDNHTNRPQFEHNWPAKKRLRKREHFMQTHNHIEAVIFDWAGTTVDYGCFAPVQVFTEVFTNAGVAPTPQEVREPMGMLKRDHIRTSSNTSRRTFTVSSEVSIVILFCVAALRIATPSS